MDLVPLYCNMTVVLNLLKYLENSYDFLKENLEVNIDAFGATINASESSFSGNDCILARIYFHRDLRAMLSS